MNTRKAVIQGNDSVRTALERERASKIDETYETEFLIERDHNLPLEFWGDKIGSGTSQKNDEKGDRGTRVNIYITSSGKLVTEVHQWQRRPEKDDRSRRKAVAHPGPEAALAWLKQDGGGILGAASKAAWLDACKTYEPLREFAKEKVE